MLAASLDLGSNTLRLLVAEVDGHGWRAVHRDMATPRLGRGLKPGGRLDAQAKASARELATAMVRKSRALGAGRIGLAATQACRLASDGAAFVDALGTELSLDRARVLSGPQEAALSRLGVTSRLTGPVDGAILADVGGGSTELAPLGQDLPGISLPVGAVSLTEAHLKTDPPSPAEMTALAKAVRRGLTPVAKLKATRLVATAGTAATVASLRLCLSSYQPEAINNLAISRIQFDQELSALAAMDLSRRQRALNLDPGRADIIVAGMMILSGLMEVLELEGLTAMDAGLLEGILLDLCR